MQHNLLFLTVMPSPYQQQLFQALHSDGRLRIRVLYYTCKALDRNWDDPRISPYEQVLPGKTIRWLGCSAHLNPTVAGALQREGSDLFVLSDYSAPTTQIAMRWLNRRKRKWVFWGEIPGFRRRTNLGNFMRDQLQRPIANGASAIAAIGSEAVSVYKALFPNVPVFNVPYFCDLSTFQLASKRRAGENRSAINILFSGQLIERKGVDVLIRAFIMISDRAPKLHLKLLGIGADVERFRKLVPSRLTARVHFLGFRQTDALPKIFAQADIFVLPSLHDGWGVVVNEALGAGLPIIVTDCVGARELVEHGSNGFITRAGDADSLAEALLKLAQSAHLRSSFGFASAERAKQWNLNEGVRRWVELSSALLVPPTQ